MRQKRAKAYRKLMELYAMSFGFRQPYQVVVDSIMCKECTAQKYDLVKQLGNVLQGTVKPMITQCCIHELYLQGRLMQPAVDLAKTFERRKCNHREPIPGDECIASIVGETNKNRYVIATQSQPLRQQLRIIAAVPIVHINRAVMILEPPSNTTIAIKESTEAQRLLPTDPEKSALSALEGEKEAAVPKKKRGPKGPNPLSVKKKKPKANDDGRRGGEARRKMQQQVEKSGEVDKSAVGEKRKRSEDGEDEGDGDERDGPGLVGDVSEEANAAHSGHKRRRRRKKATDGGEQTAE